MNETREKIKTVEDVAKTKLSFYTKDDKELQQMCIRMMTTAPERIPGKVSEN